jgi:uncharacterized membrane protein (GlpM family)
MLAFKLTLVPILIVFISLAGQRFGPTLAGLLASFPVIAGPIFIFLAVEQGDSFALQAAIATLIGLVPYAAFCVSYSWLCRSRGYLSSLAIGWLIFFVIALLLSQMHFSLLAACLVAIAVPVFAPRLFPVVGPVAPRKNMRRVEIAMRMLASAALVFAITETATMAGPVLAGLLTPFPVAGSILAAFSQRLNGPAAAIQILRGIIIGLYGFVAFFATVAATLPGQGLVIALWLGLLAALIVHGTAYWIMTNYKTRGSALNN